jgi:hypothetical protein
MFIQTEDKPRRAKLGERVVCRAVFMRAGQSFTSATPTGAATVITTCREGARVRFDDGLTCLAFAGRLATDADADPRIALAEIAGDFEPMKEAA